MSNNNTQAAANKAAEEGELPKMPALPDAWMRLSEEEGSDDYPVFINGQMHAYARDYARQAIAADRASRQVANKAEVEPVAYLTSDKRMLVFADRVTGNDHGMTALYATPPATTGASTARSIAGQDFEFLLGAYMLAMESGATRRHCADCKKALVDYIDRFVATNGKAVAASTVLTDERIDATMIKYSTMIAPGVYSLCNFECDDDMRSFAREVAAQAGQVAVPDFRNVTEVKRISDQSLTITFASCASCSKFERAAAPSPAKVSK